MVMIKLDGFIEDINGKVGGVKYRRDNCGYHMEEIKQFYKSPTNKQRAQRSRFRAATAFWKSIVLTASERSLWWGWCLMHPRVNEKGESFFLHPQLAFLSVNVLLLGESKDMVRVPPP